MLNQDNELRVAMERMVSAMSTIERIWGSEGGPERYEAVLGGESYPFANSFDEVYAMAVAWEQEAAQKLIEMGR